MAKLKFIDLFAGLGGFHLALEKLGCECVFASEIQPELQSLYERNFGMKCSGDINEIDITKDIPDHDILCAGFPCQPFSQAGKQQGFDDQKRRGNLFYKIWEILECKKRLSGNFWLVSFKISYLCLPLFYETRTTPSCHPSGCAYRQL